MNVQEIEINVVFTYNSLKNYLFQNQNQINSDFEDNCMFTGFQTTYIKKKTVKIAHSAKPNRFYEIYSQNTSDYYTTTVKVGTYYYYYTTTVKVGAYYYYYTTTVKVGDYYSTVLLL